MKDVIAWNYHYTSWNNLTDLKKNQYRYLLNGLSDPKKFGDNYGAYIRSSEPTKKIN